MSGLTIALSKGRIFEETLPLLAAAGIVPSENPIAQRESETNISWPSVPFFAWRTTAEQISATVGKPSVSASV